MLEQLLNHINRHTLCKTTDKILLAVSGGVDSMVLLHLMKEAGFILGVAHCNFQLRGEDSTGDEEFVQQRCASLNIPFHSRKFDTSAYAGSRGISVQMAARDLRYAYFGELLREFGYEVVATGHHFSDVIESVLMNLVRGTGIDGLTGIAPRKQNVVRPLLFATRPAIIAYAREHAIPWREDASNLSDDYQRNFIRHHVVPLLTRINPNFEDTFRDTHERLAGGAEFSAAYVRSFRASVQERSGDVISLDMGKIDHLEFPAVMLWELVKEFGFNFDQCRKAVRAEQPGKIFYSATHRLLVDRRHYIVDRKDPSAFPEVTIEAGQEAAGQTPHVLTLQYVARRDFHLSKNVAVAQLDADRVRFPLLWRRWRAGDYFVPLGMTQEKKVSDFLIDLKIPFNSKADVTVLEGGGDIVWVVGHRISERYKVTPATKRVLVIRRREGDE